MELWDAYFRDGNLAGQDLVRGELIPEGLYHLVCEVLVRHTDGSFLLMQRDFSKKDYPGCFEATAGGSALKGEDELACIRRELREETGIEAECLEKLGCMIADRDQTIYCTYLCITGWNKEKIRLQPGETVSFKWISEPEFISFVSSGEMIDRQKTRYADYFRRQNWL